MGVSEIRLLADQSEDQLTVAVSMQFMLDQPGRILSAAAIGQFVGGIKTAADEFGVAFDPRFVQAMLETNNGRYDGQVKPDQFNIGGIGATDDGAPGIRNKNWAEGAFRFVAHSLAWANDPRGNASPRAHLVHKKAIVTGYATTFGELGDGRWATDELYAEKLDQRWQTIQETITMSSKPIVNVLVSAGHHNKSGGDRVEHGQTGELAESLARELRAIPGFDVKVAQPDGPDPDFERGDGDLEGPLDLVGRMAVELDAQGWTPHHVVEMHTEGGGGIGVFVIYPDMQGDLDEDVRDTLGPLIAKEVSKATGLSMGAGGDGVMPESQTGVGGQGFRLGFFRSSAAIKDRSTRYIIEAGAHDKQPDLGIAMKPGFSDKVGKAVAKAIADWEDIMVPVSKPPVDPGMPGVLQADGTTLVGLVNLGGNAECVERVLVQVRNSKGERYYAEWDGHVIIPGDGGGWTGGGIPLPSRR